MLRDMAARWNVQTQRRPPLIDIADAVWRTSDRFHAPEKRGSRSIRKAKEGIHNSHFAMPRALDPEIRLLRSTND
jgi:hypothetical protein